jgi:tetratricopeptide (TPR) repeat protein
LLGKIAGNSKKTSNELNRNIPISPEAFERIESYLFGQMTAEDRQVFEQNIATDELLKAQVEQVQLMLIGIKEASLTTKLNHFHNELPASNKVGKTNNLFTLRRWLVAASITLILALGGWLLFKKSNNEKLYADFFQPDPGLISAMSTTDNYIFDKAMIDYKTGNYNEAITAWKSLLKNNLNNDTLNYFIGSSYMGLSNTREAIPYLQKVVVIPQSYFVRDAYWYLGLATLKENKLQEAIPLIERSEHPQKTVLLQKIQQGSR